MPLTETHVEGLGVVSTQVCNRVCESGAGRGACCPWSQWCLEAVWLCPLSASSPQVWRVEAGEMGRECS